jgi:hypothetical protein
VIESPLMGAGAQRFREISLIYGGGDFALTSVHHYSGLVPLPHHEPLPLLVAQFELLDRCGFGRTFVGRLHIPAGRGFEEPRRATSAACRPGGGLLGPYLFSAGHAR